MVTFWANYEKYIRLKYLHNGDASFSKNTPYHQKEQLETV